MAKITGYIALLMLGLAVGRGIISAAFSGESVFGIPQRIYLWIALLIFLVCGGIILQRRLCRRKRGQP